MVNTPHPDCITKKEIRDFRLGILHNLRHELGEMRSAQNQAILFGVTGAGVMLGILKDISFKEIAPIVLLLPLIILLPFWGNYFDKGRTIARQVGYLRVQEVLLATNRTEGALGWETAMKKYWQWKDVWDDQIHKYTIIKINERNRRTQKKLYLALVHSGYWFTTFTVFFIFSFICELLSLLRFCSGNFYIIFYIIPLITALFFTCLIFYFDYGTWDYDKVAQSSWKCGIGYFGITVISSFFLFYLDNIGLNMVLMYITWIAFSAVFIYTTGITFSVFKNIVQGRYSYYAFEYRWNVILGLIDRPGEFLIDYFPEFASDLCRDKK